MRVREKINDGRIASTRNSDSMDSTDVQEEIQVESEPVPKKWCLRNKVVALCRHFKKSIESSEIPAAKCSLRLANEGASEW